MIATENNRRKNDCPREYIHQIYWIHQNVYPLNDYRNQRIEAHCDEKGSYPNSKNRIQRQAGLAKQCF